MYPVSKEYQKAISESSRSFFWTGTITTKAGKKYTFGNKDIVKGSGYISRQCSARQRLNSALCMQQNLEYPFFQILTYIYNSFFSSEGWGCL